MLDTTLEMVQRLWEVKRACRLLRHSWEVNSVDSVFLVNNRFWAHTEKSTHVLARVTHTRVGTLIVATIYLQLIQNRYMFRSFTVLQCSHQHCVQPVASDVEVVGYL